MKTWTSVCSDDAVPGHSWIKVDPVSSNSSWDFWKCGLTWDSSILPSDNRTSYGKMDPSADSLPIMILLCNYNEHAEHVILSMANVLDWRATWRHRVLPSVRIPGPASAASMECQGLTGAFHAGLLHGLLDGLLGLLLIVMKWVIPSFPTWNAPVRWCHQSDARSFIILDNSMLFVVFASLTLNFRWVSGKKWNCWCVTETSTWSSTDPQKFQIEVPHCPSQFQSQDLKCIPVLLAPILWFSYNSSCWFITKSSLNTISKLRALSNSPRFG